MLPRFPNPTAQTALSISSLLQACSHLHHLKQAHAQILLHGLQYKHLILTKKLTLQYISFNCIDPANHSFKTIPNPCNFLYNMIIRANATNGLFDQSLKLYSEMIHCGLRPVLVGRSKYLVHAMNALNEMESRFLNSHLRKADMVLFWFLLVAALAVSTMSVEAEDTMFNGERLLTNQFVENGPYKFIMQGDCNLVLYVMQDNKGKALWDSETQGQGDSCFLLLQNNGNLVIFSGSDVVWSSRSTRGPNSYRLVVQTDGNVVIYGGATWATNTVRNSKAKDQH